MTATSTGFAQGPQTPLAPGNWWPGNHALLQQLLDQPGLAGRCAAFDWDNTSIHNDLGDAAFRWQLDHLQLVLPPHLVERQWAEPLQLLREAGLPCDHAQRLYQDVAAAWRALWPEVVLGRGEQVRHGPAHLDLRSKWASLYGLLAAAGEGAPAVQARTYALVAQLWGGLATDAPAQCVGALIRRGEEALPVPVTWTPATPGAAGSAPYTFRCGLRPFHEMRALMAALRHRDVRVAVVSASFEPLVLALARAWSYPVASEAIFGIRLGLAEAANAAAPKRFAIQLAANYPVTYRAGKVRCMEENNLASPVLVAGDALTDLEFLTHWPETQVRLLLHRARPAPPVAQLHEAALAAGTTPLGPQPRSPRTLLQGRNDVVGAFWPRQLSGPAQVDAADGAPSASGEQRVD